MDLNKRKIVALVTQLNPDHLIIIWYWLSSVSKPRLNMKKHEKVPKKEEKGENAQNGPNVTKSIQIKQIKSFLTTLDSIKSLRRCQNRSNIADLPGSDKNQLDVGDNMCWWQFGISLDWWFIWPFLSLTYQKLLTKLGDGPKNSLIRVTCAYFYLWSQNDFDLELTSWAKNELENVQCIYMQYKWYDQYVADLGINYIKL